MGLSYLSLPFTNPGPRGDEREKGEGRGVRDTGPDSHKLQFQTLLFTLVSFLVKNFGDPTDPEWIHYALHHPWNLLQKVRGQKSLLAIPLHLPVPLKPGHLPTARSLPPSSSGSRGLSSAYWGYPSKLSWPTLKKHSTLLGDESWGVGYCYGESPQQPDQSLQLV